MTFFFLYFLVLNCAGDDVGIYTLVLILVHAIGNCMTIMFIGPNSSLLATYAAFKWIILGVETIANMNESINTQIVGRKM